MSDFRDFKAKADAELKTLCDDVYEYLHHPLSQPRLMFLLDVLSVFSPVVRLFDTSSMFSNCFVYSAIDSLPETVKIVLSKPMHQKAELDLSEDFYKGLASAIVDKFDKHRKPVFSAGFMLCHLNIYEIRRRKVEDPEEYALIFDETIRVLTTLFCRWDLTSLTVRKTLLEEDSAEVRAFVRDARADLRDMVSGLGKWQGLCWDDLIDDDRMDPASFWQSEAPRCSLNAHAARIVSLDPSSCDAERLHLVTKLFRTKQRNRLMYTTNHQLSLAKVDMLQDDPASSTGLSWKELKRIHTRMSMVTDEEESWLNELEKDWLKVEPADAEDAPIEVEVNVEETSAQADMKESEQAASGSVDDEEPQIISGRGRRRKQKVFTDFVRFDDDLA